MQFEDFEEQVFEISRLDIHEGYNMRNRLDNDIAVLKLKVTSDGRYGIDFGQRVTAVSKKNHLHSSEQLSNSTPYVQCVNF